VATSVLRGVLAQTIKNKAKTKAVPIAICCRKLKKGFIPLLWVMLAFLATLRIGGACRNCRLPTFGHISMFTWDRVGFVCAVDAVLLRPLPYPDSERLVQIPHFLVSLIWMICCES